MAQIQNASPYADLLGMDDVSTRTVTYESSTLPIHLPHVWSYAQWGPTEPLLVVGSTATNTYGAATFEPRSKYVTHQWPLIQRMIARSNAMVFQRIRPADAPDPATIGLYLDVLETTIPLYQRNPDGSFKYDSNGAKIETGQTVQGIRAKWVIGKTANLKLGKATKTAGSQTDGTATSTIYPILEFQTSFFGDAGNNRGLQLWAPTMADDTPVNSRVVADQRAQLYRLKFIRRDDAKSSGKTVRTLTGAEYVDFAFREDVIDSKTSVEYGFDLTVLDSYRSLNVAGTSNPKVWGPFNKSFIYTDNLNELLEMLYTVEQPNNSALEVTTNPDDYHLINFVSGVHYTGVPYYAYEVLGADAGGNPLTETATYYAAGGGDGTMSKQDFDNAVGTICEEYDAGEWQLSNRLRYPQSVIYDTGFDSVTKFKLFQVLSARKDIAVIASTQDIALEQNDQAAESSMATVLQTQASLHPESDYYGTPVARAAVVGHSGHLINSKYRALVPMTVDLADKLALYGGSSSGVLTADNAPDVNPNNLVTLLKDVNCTFKTATVRNTDWSNGMVWVESYDQTDALFYPGLQTVYSDDTSVLNSIPTMMICVELEKVCVRAWARLTGRSDLTAEQFIQRSNELITELTENRFGGRVVVVPETYYTDMDTARGYSWSCKIKLYANNMKTVGSFTIEAHRMSDLTETTA